MNQEERNKLRKHYRTEKWKKGKALTKEEMGNIAKGYIFSHEKKPLPLDTWQPKSNEPTSINNLLTKYMEEKSG